MYISIVAAYKQKNKHENSKVKVHLQKETNYHTMPIYFENDFFFVDHLSLGILYHLMFAHNLFSLQCAGSLKLKTHMVCLGGHMLTLEET